MHLQSIKLQCDTSNLLSRRLKNHLWHDDILFYHTASFPFLFNEHKRTNGFSLQFLNARFDNESYFVHKTQV